MVHLSHPKSHYRCVSSLDNVQFACRQPLAINKQTAKTLPTIFTINIDLPQVLNPRHIDLGLVEKTYW